MAYSVELLNFSATYGKCSPFKLPKRESNRMVIKVNDITHGVRTDFSTGLTSVYDINQNCQKCTHTFLN